MPRRQHAAVEHLVRPRRRHEGNEPLGALLGRQLQRRRPVRPGPVQREAYPVVWEHLDPVQRERWGSERRQPRSPEPEVAHEPAQRLAVARSDEPPRVQAIPFESGVQRRQRKLSPAELLHSRGLALSHRGLARHRRRLQQRQRVVGVVVVALRLRAEPPPREPRLAAGSDADDELVDVGLPPPAGAFRALRGVEGDECTPLRSAHPVHLQPHCLELARDLRTPLDGTLLPPPPGRATHERRGQPTERPTEP